MAAKEIIGKLNDAIVEVLADPKLRQRFAENRQEISPRDQLTREALDAYQKAEAEKWWPSSARPTSKQSGEATQGPRIWRS